MKELLLVEIIYEKNKIKVNTPNLKKINEYINKGYNFQKGRTEEINDKYQRYYLQLFKN